MTVAQLIRKEISGEGMLTESETFKAPSIQSLEPIISSDVKPAAAPRPMAGIDAPVFNFRDGMGDIV
jgi:hypothetical protein